MSGQLAATLGIDLREFVDIFGAAWRRNDAEPWHDYDEDPSGKLAFEPTPWFIAGEPPQLMLRVFPHGVFVGRPEGIWAHGTHGLEYQPGHQEYVGRDREPETFAERADVVVRKMLTARRRTFKYCPYCRAQTPPELRWKDDRCQDCASQWDGVVY